MYYIVLFIPAVISNFIYKKMVRKMSLKEEIIMYLIFLFFDNVISITSYLFLIEKDGYLFNNIKLYPSCFIKYAGVSFIVSIFIALGFRFLKYLISYIKIEKVCYENKKAK